MIQGFIAFISFLVFVAMLGFFTYRVYYEYNYRRRQRDSKRVVSASKYECNWSVTPAQRKLYWEIQRMALKQRHTVLMTVPASELLRVKSKERYAEETVKKLRSVTIDFLICDENLNPKVAVYLCGNRASVSSASWFDAALQFNGIEVLYISRLDRKSRHWLEQSLAS